MCINLEEIICLIVIINREKGGIKMKYTGDILKDKPEYEDYSENEAKLTIEEMRELGILRCGGCCSSGKNNKGCNKCSKGKKCCKSI